MLRTIHIPAFLFIILLALAGCSRSESISASGVEITREENRIFITDRTGKKWDVTHAVQKYNFDVNRFEFGLGPFAIRPFRSPEFLSEGDPGYPPDDAAFLIMGTEIDGDARAYKISDMSWHEVADDTFGDVHVAVAY